MVRENFMVLITYVRRADLFYPPPQKEICNCVVMEGDGFAISTNSESHTPDTVTYLLNLKGKKASNQ